MLSIIIYYIISFPEEHSVKEMKSLKYIHVLKK